MDELAPLVTDIGLPGAGRPAGRRRVSGHRAIDADAPRIALRFTEMPESPVCLLATVADDVHTVGLSFAEVTLREAVGARCGSAGQRQRVRSWRWSSESRSALLHFQLRSIPLTGAISSNISTNRYDPVAIRDSVGSRRFWRLAYRPPGSGIPEQLHQFRSLLSPARGAPNQRLLGATNWGQPSFAADCRFRRAMPARSIHIQ